MANEDLRALFDEAWAAQIAGHFSTIESVTKQRDALADLLRDAVAFADNPGKGRYEAEQSQLAEALLFDIARKARPILARIDGAAAPAHEKEVP